MKKLLLISTTLFATISQINYAQISIVEIDPDSCRLFEYYGYSYSNEKCGYHAYGHTIYKNGTVVYKHCPPSMGSDNIESMVFISETTGFKVVDHSVGSVAVYKTTDSGESWVGLGSGLPEYLDYYPVSAHTGFLFTHHEFCYQPDSSYCLTRVSDLKNNPYRPGRCISSDTVVSDTIFGSPFCEIDTLYVIARINNDTIELKINLVGSPLNTFETDVINDFIVFPNPVSSSFSICGLHSNLYEPTLNIYNYLGIKVKSIKLETIDNIEVSVDDLQKGYYILEISDGKNRMVKPLLKTNCLQ
jgi:hypothetical protein